MKSSNVENMFSLKASLEEEKSLSPLTYYKPFQSSFDPEFGKELPRRGLEAERRVSGPFGGLPPVRGLTLAGSRPSCSRPHLPFVSPPGAFFPFPPKPPCGPSALENSSLLFGAPSQAGAQAPLHHHPVSHPLVKGGIYKGGHPRPMICNFCKNNKEVPDIYLNHYLYDPETKVLTCPVLRKHVCEICGGTGDRAHTLQYCPVNRERGLQAKVPVLLRTRTITNSTGKIRRN